jgi:hypothetical protein
MAVDHLMRFYGSRLRRDVVCLPGLPVIEAAGRRCFRGIFGLICLGGLKISETEPASGTQMRAFAYDAAEHL